MIEKILQRKFRHYEIEWRIGRAGIGSKGLYAVALAYVTNRAIMDRLDEAFGVTGWSVEYAPGPIGGVKCRITVRDAEGNEIYKEDGAGERATETIKSGYSDAMKRCAVQFGIGRYLYQLDETFVSVSPNRDSKHVKYQKANQNQKTPAFYWAIPELPQWALPEAK